MDKQTHRIVTLLQDKLADLLVKVDRMGRRADRLGEVSLSYDRLLEEQGSIQPFEERRLERLVKIANRAEDLARKVEERIELVREALRAVEREADVFGRVKPVSLAEMLK